MEDAFALIIGLLLIAFCYYLFVTSENDEHIIDKQKDVSREKKRSKNNTKDYIPTIVCSLGMIYGVAQSFYFDYQAQSVYHQLYSGQYSIIASMFLCTWLIVYTISKK